MQKVGISSIIIQQDIPSRPRLYLIQRASQDISLQDLFEDIPRTTHSPKVEVRHMMLMIDTVSRNREKKTIFF